MTAIEQHSKECQPGSCYFNTDGTAWKM